MLPPYSPLRTILPTDDNLLQLLPSNIVSTADYGLTTYSYEYFLPRPQAKPLARPFSYSSFLYSCCYRYDDDCRILQDYNTEGFNMI